MLNQAASSTAARNNPPSTHTSDMRRKAHICTICGKSFKRNSKLQIHMDGRAHKPRPEKICKCTECGKAFKSPSKLSRHMEDMHSGRKPPPKTPANFPCTDCGKMLQSNTKVKRHKESMHTAVRQGSLLIPKIDFFYKG